MRMVSNAVLILPIEKEKTEAGVFLVAKDGLTGGNVIDCGPLCREVKIGDEVYYQEKKSSRIVIDDVPHNMINENFIVYVKEN